MDIEVKSQVKFLKGPQMYEQIEIKIKDLMEILSMNRDKTLIIMHHFSWNNDKITQEYFNNPEKIKAIAGIVD